MNPGAPGLLFRIFALAVFLQAGDAVGETSDSSVPHRYRIGVDGPLGVFAIDCIDPCEVKETRSRPQAPPEVFVERGEAPAGRPRRQRSTLKRDPALSYMEEGIVCIGNCAPASPASKVMIGPLASLEEGVALRVRDGRARFLFLSVIERDGVPAARRLVSEFRIDRPHIDVELHGHRVTVDRRSGSEAE